MCLRGGGIICSGHLKILVCKANYTNFDLSLKVWTEIMEVDSVDLHSSQWIQVETKKWCLGKHNSNMSVYIIESAFSMLTFLMCFSVL